jgi:hypothetical protein
MSHLAPFMLLLRRPCRLPPVWSATRVDLARTRLQVTIWNTGADGDTFMPELMGPQITIRKTLSAKGASSLKVLNARGEATDVSTAKALQRMLDALSVNAANPSIVLTQDHARGLLSDGKAQRRLYELLMESLGFDTTVEMLQESKARIAVQVEQARRAALPRATLRARSPCLAARAVSGLLCSSCVKNITMLACTPGTSKARLSEAARVQISTFEAEKKKKEEEIDTVRGRLEEAKAAEDLSNLAFALQARPSSQDLHKLALPPHACIAALSASATSAVRSCTNGCPVLIPHMRTPAAAGHADVLADARRGAQGGGVRVQAARGGPCGAREARGRHGGARRAARRVRG